MKNDRSLLDKNQALWSRSFGFTVLLHPKINVLTNSIFLSFLEIKKYIFCLFQDFQGPQPKFKDFPEPGIFFSQFQDFPGFSKDRGNPN